MFSQLDYFNFFDRLFFLFAYCLPLTVIVFGIALVIEYNVEMRKKKKHKRR